MFVHAAIIWRTEGARVRGNAVIVGAGIGGLAAALALRRAGWSVGVLEQAARVEPVGSGISLWPNALRCLDALGVGEKARAAGVMAVSRGGLRLPSGRWLRRRHPDDIPVLMLHRAELHRVLLAALPAGCVRTGTSAIGVSESGADVTVTYQTRNGAGRDTADLVVGADGIDSTVRRTGWPTAWPPLFDRRTAWRGITRPDQPPFEECLTLTAEQQFGMLPLPDGRVYWFLTARADRPGVWYPDELAEVRRRVAGWHAPIAALLDATPPDAVLHHDISALAPLGGYATRRTVLIGDAAHALTPDLGQGACQALEDAVVLGAQLAGGADLEAALAGYDRLRRPRTQALARAALRQKRLNERWFGLVKVAARVTPPAAWRRQVRQWTDWTPPALPAG
jgi:2-polyprenyl-6-methoxyphenol hydroxylase-like FAD-dependent oxidoreductase